MVGIVVIIIGLLYGYIVGVFKVFSNLQTVDGVIKEIRHESDNDQDIPSYRAFIEYIIDGKSYELKSSYKSSKFRSGDTVLVSYEKSNPKNASIKPKTKHYIVFAIVIIVGIFMLLNI
jgi:cytochrome c oxidase assembly protein Cox11